MNVRFSGAVRLTAILAIAALLACAVWLAVGRDGGATAQPRPSAGTPEAGGSPTADETTRINKPTVKPVKPKATASARSSTASPSADPTTPEQDGPEPSVTTKAPKPETGSTDAAVPKPRIGKPSEVGKGRTVPAKPPKTKEPVPLDDTGDFGTGLKVVITDIKSVEGEATAPGEIAGPAIRVTIAAQNTSEQDVDLDHVQLFVAYGKDQAPSNNLREGTRALTGKLKPGTAQEGIYVFRIPTEKRDRVRIEVSFSGETPVVAFEGPL